ncbi:MAG: hypothetical protein ACLTDR_12955 [Adlercreutzia equolifaciens]
MVFTSALGLSRFDLDGGFMDYLGGLSQTPQVWLDHQAMGEAAASCSRGTTCPSCSPTE